MTASVLFAVNVTCAAAGSGSNAGWFALGGAFVGVAGTGLATFMSNGATSRRDAARLAHERGMAAEARTQDRIERAYLRLLGAINHAQQLIETDATDKPAPDYDAVNAGLAGVWTELDAFGSNTVADLHNKWRAAWLLFQVDMSNARDRETRNLTDSPLLAELLRNRKDALAAAKALRDRIAAELRGDETG